MAEDHSGAVQEVMLRGNIATSRWTLVELASGLHRRHREGRLDRRELDPLLIRLREDAAALHLEDVTAAILDSAAMLLNRHILRTGDAVQLATCLAMRTAAGERPEFLAFDRALNKAAVAEGCRLIKLAPD